MSNNNIALITGANGMDAKTLTHFLLKRGYKVILTYRRNTYFDEQLILNIFSDDLKKNPSAELYCHVCDISCQNSVTETIKSVLRQHGRIDELYLLAAMSHVGQSFKHKELSIITNGQSYYYFLDALHNFSPKTRTYGALTSELAGHVNDGEFFSENTTWNPKSPYAIGKELAGRWLKFYRESKDTQLYACTGILFNHSNTYRSKDFVIRKITNAAARIAVGKQSELNLAHINWARDEHWSDFGCEMMWKMLQQPEPEDFVIGAGETHWGEEYLNYAFGYFNLDWKKYVKFDKALERPNDVVRLVSDSKKAQIKLGWNPTRMPFKDHIDLMCKFDYELESGLTPVRPDVFELYPN